jgi:hypothetical protein
MGSRKLDSSRSGLGGVKRVTNFRISQNAGNFFTSSELTALPPSCAECHEIWEPQPPETLRA